VEKNSHRVVVVMSRASAMGRRSASGRGDARSASPAGRDETRGRDRVVVGGAVIAVARAARGEVTAQAVPVSVPVSVAQPPLPPTPPPDARSGDVKILGRRHRDRGIGAASASARERTIAPVVMANEVTMGTPMRGDSFSEGSLSSSSPSSSPSSPMETTTPERRGGDGGGFGGGPPPPAHARDRGVIDLDAEVYEDSRPHVEVLHIPNSKVGLVIGREGRHVGFVQNRTRTRISIARDSWDGAKRRVEIEGTPERCREAVAMIHRLIEDSNDRTRDDEGAIAALFESMGGTESAAVLLREQRAELAEDVDARYRETSAEFDGSVTRREHTPTGSRLAPATATMTIPHTKVGMIIGRSGENVKFIQQRTRAKIQIQTDAETPEGAPARMVYLRGPVDACRNAARMINDMCIGRMPIHSPAREALGHAAGSPSMYAVEGASTPPIQPPSAASRATTPYQAAAMHHMEYHQPMYAPAYFGQPYTGLYNPPYGAQEQYPMPYYTPQYPMPYYAQPPMMSPYAMEYAQEQRKYYEEPPHVERESASGVAEDVAAGGPSPESPEMAREPTTPPASRSNSPLETEASSDATMSPKTPEDETKT
jgi:far upstream element-binding protein